MTNELEKEESAERQRNALMDVAPNHGRLIKFLNFMNLIYAIIEIKISLNQNIFC